MSKVTSVQTVAGEVDGRQLGLTLPHEHVFSDLSPEYGDDGRLDDFELAVREVLEFKNAGGGTIVDCTNESFGRDPSNLRRVADATGINIVMGSGFYRSPYIEKETLKNQSPNELAHTIVDEITSGAGPAAIRPGIIGEVGFASGRPTLLEGRVLRAAAMAHRETGLSIMTHALFWPAGLLQLDLLEEEGVPPGRVIVGHCDQVQRPDYHLALSKRGAFVEFDSVRGQPEQELHRQLSYIANMVSHGLIDRILISQDVCLRSHRMANGGSGYTYVPLQFIQRLASIGLSPDDVRTITVDNPRRALTGD